ncbi:cAMP-dependent protein kinase regulatory subunit, dimerization-anchoring domain [Cinara cedri]|uniref:cAMP-dependent protein kinase regulatory subunit, dimerization-anchoring domain n=1 Tax=Cinara cedri TaxID=506608 RepID=A0A5E4MMZ9_9HEMI|nr:cAMP-dependent protein kinase regulatory subunit, dimerization-anchoring domain [Cinara cedri]
MTSIIIPDGLAELLKNYVKAAIRSQPEDIVSWSAEYFKTTDKQPTAAPGLQENCSFAVYKQDRTLFRILAFQLGTTVSTKDRIEEVWSDLSLDFSLLEQIYRIGQFHEEQVKMVEFLGVTFGHWTKSLKETVLLCCEAFCKCLATDGYFLHVDVACKLYRFLAKLDCSVPVNHSNDDSGQSRDNTGASDAGRGKSTVKTAKSLDVFSVRPSTSFAENNVCCTSLESIFGHPAAADDVKFVRSGTGCCAPGIGPPVPTERIQKVIEYFQRCAADNGGYVYDFDIENDNCPQLDAVVENAFV